MIGREREQELLLDLRDSDESEFACVYGRRRVGKTYLVDEIFSGDYAFFATASERATNAQQLALFGDFLEEYGDDNRTSPKSWREAFKRLRLVLSAKAGDGNKLIVFIDELPWFDKPKSDFMAAFSLFWNAWASKRRDVLLIVCGSATSWIIEHVLENSGDLFNRVSEMIYLAPFTLRETQDYLESRKVHWDERTVLECYMVFGGLPYYLKRINRRQGLAQNITELCLKPHARFRNEYSQILESSFRKTQLHRHILEVLSTVKQGMTRQALLEALGMDGGGSFKKAVGELEECGYIRRYRNEHAKSSKTFFQLVDLFFMFALNFMIEGDYNKLAERPPENWSAYIDTPSYYAWRGKAFEAVCTSHVERIVDALRVYRGVTYQAFAWNSRSEEGGAQVDLVIECSDRVTYLCEMKCPNGRFKMDKATADSLRSKLEAFRREAAEPSTTTMLVMVFGSEFDGDFDIGEPVQCVGLEALFR